MMNEIVKLILEMAEKEEHPDRVSCIHAVLMQVNMATGNVMLKIRMREKKDEIQFKKNR